MLYLLIIFFFFFFNDTATTEIYTLSLHDALPISWMRSRTAATKPPSKTRLQPRVGIPPWRSRDRKSTRLNSSHLVISYAVFCLKKKKKKRNKQHVLQIHMRELLCQTISHNDQSLL